jgi:AcrR family transcriptional regulator
MCPRAETAPAKAVAKEEKILEAARKRFAYFGFPKVTMDEIAADVGLAKPSLYYYYPTKESLFRAVIASEQTRFLGNLEALLARETSAQAKLRNYVDLRYDLFRELANLSALGTQTYTEWKSLSGDLFRALEEKELGMIHSVLLQGERSGEFGTPDPLHTARTLLHVMHGLRLRLCAIPTGAVLENEAYAALRKEMDLVITMFIDGMKSHHSHLH